MKSLATAWHYSQRGGAPIIREFCTRIAADFYSPNPHEAVEYLNGNV